MSVRPFSMPTASIYAIINCLAVIRVNEMDDMYSVGRTEAVKGTHHRWFFRASALNGVYV